MAFQFTQTGQELQYLADTAEKIAAEYDAAASWTTGDYCTHEGTIYRCTASTTGTFDATKWTAVILCDELEGLRTRMSTAEGNISTAQGDITTAQGNITSINTTLTGVSSYTTVSLTAGTNVSISSSKKVVIGKISGYALQFTTSATISVRSLLMSGLDYPVNSAAGYAIAQGMNTGTAAAYAFAVYASGGVGELRNLDSLPAGTYRLGIVYLTN